MKEILTDKSDINNPPSILDQLTTFIEHKEVDITPSEMHLIAICGVSASGKSHLVRMLNETLEESDVINIDDFLDPHKISTRDGNHPAYADMRVKGKTIEGVDPRLWNFPAVINSVLRSVDGKITEIPVYDPISKRASHTRALTSMRRLILEGAHAFTIPDIQEKINTRILLEAPLHDRLIRKIIRSSRINLRKDMNEPIARYLLSSEPAWQAHKEMFESMADLFIDNPADPSIDYLYLDSLPSVEDISYVLRPTKETGKLHKGEYLRLSSSDNSEQTTFTYGVGDKTLVNCSITLDTLDLLLNHYEIHRQV